MCALLLAAPVVGQLRKPSELPQGLQVCRRAAQTVMTKLLFPRKLTGATFSWGGARSRRKAAKHESRDVSFRRKRRSRLGSGQINGLNTEAWSGEADSLRKRGQGKRILCGSVVRRSGFFVGSVVLVFQQKTSGLSQNPLCLTLSAFHPDGNWQERVFAARAPPRGPFPRVSGQVGSQAASARLGGSGGTFRLNPAWFGVFCVLSQEAGRFPCGKALLSP